MPHFFLEGLECEWTLVRETPSSLKLKATTEGKALAVDVHFTTPKVLTVNLAFTGQESEVKKSWLTPVMDDIARIALKRDDYAVIDYTLVCGGHMSDGNYSIDDKARKAFKL